MPCTQCISGTIHEGLPTGTIEKLYNLDTYITGNRSSPSAVIVMYSDIFGIPLPNNRLIADAYAKANPSWLVYLVDFYDGDPVSLKVADVLIPADAAAQSTFAKYTGILASVPGYIAWALRHKEGHTHQVCIDWLSALRRDPATANKKVGMVGMCWGGNYAIRAARKDINKVLVKGKTMPLADAVVAVHPSNLALPADIGESSVPITFGWGEKDSFVKIETKGQVEELHARQKTIDAEMPHMEHKVYFPGRHGFAVRGNPDDPNERKCLQDSVAQVTDWFDRYL